MKQIDRKKKREITSQAQTYIARKRCKMALDMKIKHPYAFLLLDEIAVRARRVAGEFVTKRGFTYYLEAGDCLIPTYSEMGMTESQWRHAVKVLRDTYRQIKTYQIGEGLGKRTAATLVKDDIFDINLDIKTRIERIKKQVENNAKPVFKKAENATDTTTDTTTDRGVFYPNNNRSIESGFSNHDGHNDGHNDVPNNNDFNKNGVLITDALNSSTTYLASQGRLNEEFKADRWRDPNDFQSLAGNAIPGNEIKAVESDSTGDIIPASEAQAILDGWKQNPKPPADDFDLLGEINKILASSASASSAETATPSQQTEGVPSLT